MRSNLFLLVACFTAALVPLLGKAAPADPGAEFPGWPPQFEGRDLRPLPLTSREREFAQDFPGRIGRFTDGEREIMGIRHRQWPLHGVQFHPESFLTPRGSDILRNFLAIGTVASKR